MKSAPPRDLVAAERTVAAGDALLAPEITRRMIEPTVKTHVSRILAKLGLRGRIQAVILAYQSGLVQPGS